MAALIARFDSLPPEILKRIAAHSPTDSLLALISVSRRLYATLHDPTVFKAVVRNGNNYATIDGTHDIDRSWGLDFLPPPTPVATYARWAMADLRARQWIADQEFPPEILFTEAKDKFEEELQKCVPCSSIAAFAPQLVIQGYPLLQHVSKSLMIHRCNHPGGKHKEVIRFLLALTLLQHTATALELQDSKHIDLLLLLRIPLQQLASLDTVRYSVPAIYFTHEILARCQKRPERWIVPPKVDRIPLKELLNLGLPFSELPPDGKLPMVISRTFLEDGEWVGYYSLRMDPIGSSIDPPMKRIRFQTEEVDEHGKIKLKSRGVDRVGGFDLTGWVTMEGRVRINKDYALGPQWDWDGVLGPLGIIGNWCSGGQPHGMFWIWKKKWSVE